MARFSVLIGLLCLSFAAHSSFRLQSYNIRNFSSAKSTNLTLLKKILLENKADVLSVQEIKNATLFKKFIETEFKSLNYKAVISKCGGAGNQKLGFVYDSKRFDLKSFTEDLSLSGKSPSCNGSSRPAAIAVFEDTQENKTLAAISVHLKAGGCRDCIAKRKFQLSKLSTIIKKHNDAGISNIAVLGDFNTTEYNKDPKAAQAFKKWVAKHSMRDSAEKMKCSAYWKGRNRNDQMEEPSLLDHVLITRNFLKGFRKAEVETSLHCKQHACESAPARQMGKAYSQVSDHCPISINMR